MIVFITINASAFILRYILVLLLSGVVSIQPVNSCVYELCSDG